MVTGTSGSGLHRAGVYATYREGQWEVSDFSVPGGFPFVQEGAVTCGGGLAVGGDWGLIGYFSPSGTYEHFIGGASDFVLASLAVTCGNKVYVGGHGPPGPESFISTFGMGSQPIEFDTHVAGAADIGACDQGVLYYYDVWTDDGKTIARYR